MQYEYVLVLGSNLGDRSAFIQAALKELQEIKNMQIARETQEVTTVAHHTKNQNNFKNKAVLIKTDLQPVRLLKHLKNIEKSVGRSENRRYGAREIDIDIVWWSEGSYLDHALEIPHPYNRGREWVRGFIGELLPDEIKYSSMPKQAIQAISDFIKKKKDQEPITILTCYDHTMANLLSRTSLDAVLVGDSLGSVVQGDATTLRVRLEQMIYHTACVRKGVPDKFLISDMPFLSYKISREKAVENAGRLVQEANADAVKVEGAGYFLEFIQAIIEAGIPVMGHLGLEPQMYLHLEGHKLQARSKEKQDKLLEKAKALEQIGCFALVLEMIPSELSKRVSSALKIPTIGIGAGKHTDGQVLVLQDMLGMNPDFQPRICRRYKNLSNEIITAVEKFCNDVHKKEFPSEDESFIETNKNAS